MADLKACPFCGQLPRVAKSDADMVWCPNSNCANYCNGFVRMHWNTRAQASAPEGGEAVAPSAMDEEVLSCIAMLEASSLPTGGTITKPGLARISMAMRTLYTRINAKAGEVEKDAARYRFIKSAPAGTVRADFHSFLPSYYKWGNGQSLDEAIDIALSTQRGEASEMGVDS